MAKFIIFLVVVLFSVYFTEQSHFLSKEYIQKINQVAKTWKAKQNFPSNTSIHQIKQLMGVLSLKRNFNQNSTRLKEYDSSYKNQNNIPDTFDARTHWSHCTTIGEITNQGNCGSCWAVSAAAAFSDRWCIATNGTINQQLSAEQLAFCCTGCGFGCLGGFPMPTWRYFATHGLVSGGYKNEGCQPYKVPPCVFNEKGKNSCAGKPIEINHVCHKKCVGDKRIIYRDNIFKAKNNYDVYYTDWPQEVLEDGPIQVQFFVYDDFLSYASGVYQKTKNAKKLGRHAVKLIGWGTENGVPYWLMVNSWGAHWGDKGLFKIRRGTDECSLELVGWTGLPLVV